MAAPVRRELGLGLANWSTTVLGQAPPRWSTPNQIVAEWPIARLRKFSESGSSRPVPTLFVPPQAGHASCIVDLTEQTSQVRAAKRAGLPHVHSLDWIAASDATKTASIDDYLRVLAESVHRLGGRVNLVGNSQGGWLAAIYAALHPHTVNTLSVVGSPVDFHAGRPPAAAWLQTFAPAVGLAVHRGVVFACGGVLPGEFSLAALIAAQPEAEIVRPLERLALRGAADQRNRQRAVASWRLHPQPVPGAFYLWMVEHLFQNNELIAGELSIDARPVRLGEISCPLNLLAGAADHIAPLAQVFALADHAGTPAEDTIRRVARCGHLELWTDPAVLHEHWTPLLAGIAARTA